MISIDETNLECSEESNFYDIYKAGRSPRVLLGYKISTIYDHNRHSISANLNPKRIRVLSKDFDDLNEWYFIYGIEVEPTVDVQHMFHNMIDLKPLDITCYYDHLEMFGLTCDENYLLSRKNIYIIDSRHLATMTDSLYTSYNELKKTMTDNKTNFYQNCDSVKIFLIV